MSPTIDHILPLARGGTHEPSNVQAAHFGCNAAKGARVPATVQ
jgi:5-methylcytosine-specific restriction endonuclease McrA